MRVAMSSEQEQALGLQSYREVLAESDVVTSGREYELVVNVARRLARDFAHSLLMDLQAFDLVRHPHGDLLGRALELGDNVTAYDGMYVALAEALDAPLVTTDGKLAKVPGKRAKVVLMR
jgi:predicted nucleic acid-binding protein